MYMCDVSYGEGWVSLQDKHCIRCVDREASVRTDFCPQFEPLVRGLADDSLHSQHIVSERGGYLLAAKIASTWVWGKFESEVAKTSPPRPNMRMRIYVTSTRICDVGRSHLLKVDT